MTPAEQARVDGYVGMVSQALDDEPAKLIMEIDKELSHWSGKYAWKDLLIRCRTVLVSLQAGQREDE
jgi:hypothetical protein